jgi:hypothetical protein
MKAKGPFFPHTPKDWHSILVFFLLSLLSACHSPAPHLPLHWPQEPVTAAIGHQEQASLEIFVVYSRWVCSHTALRLHHPELGSMIWDPAGGYGIEGIPPDVSRKEDLIICAPNSTADYLDFRKSTPTAAMEIFYFPVDPTEAEHMMRLLQAGASGEKGHPKTRTQPFFCCTAISEFLAANGPSGWDVRPCFFPHTLSAMLYRQKHLMLFIFDRDGIRRAKPEPSSPLCHRP